MRKKTRRDRIREREKKEKQEEPSADQIDSCVGVEQSSLFKNIVDDLDNLLDSDDDYLKGFGQEDGMIEKDLDNWI